MPPFEPKGMNMSIPQVTLLTDCIAEVIESQTGLVDIVKAVLRHPDISAVAEQYRKELDPSPHRTLTNLITAQEESRQLMERFSYVLMYLEDEIREGTKGEWREIVKAQSNQRVSIDAIRSLRETFGTGLRDAKFIVEAYSAGLFE
jgi:hypothetical protein